MLFKQRAEVDRGDDVDGNKNHIIRIGIIKEPIVGFDVVQIGIELLLIAMFFIEEDAHLAGLGVMNPGIHGANVLQDGTFMVFDEQADAFNPRVAEIGKGKVAKSVSSQKGSAAQGTMIGKGG